MAMRQERGRDGEDIAVDLLQSRGYRVVQRNWRPGGGMRGELDIIAWHDRTLCFVEVKARSSRASNLPQESVTLSKQMQISRLANLYTSQRGLDDIDFRFDVVEVWLFDDGQKPRVALHQNAFPYREGGSRRYG